MIPPALRRLEAWVQAGLLTPEQATAIAAFEAREGETAPASRWLSYAFMALGGIILGLGVISIVAANWGDIPDGVKLAADFLLLAGIGAWGWLQLENNACCRRELPLLLFTLLCLASLGLIGQIYHLEGPLHETLLLWCGFTLPVVSLSRRQVLPALWSGALLASLTTWFSLQGAAILPSSEARLTATLVAMPLFCLLLAKILEIPSRLRLVAGGVRFWFWSFAALGVGAMEIHAQGGSRPFLETPLFLLPGLLLALPVGAATFAEPQKRLGVIQRLLLLLYVGMGAVVLLFNAPDWISAPFTFALASLGAIHAAMVKRFRLAQQLLLLAGLRAYLVFLDLFASLLATGLGLMVAGGTLLGLVYLWQRHRPRMVRWLEGMTP